LTDLIELAEDLFLKGHALEHCFDNDIDISETIPRQGRLDKAQPLIHYC
jgi:hypothetical protein